MTTTTETPSAFVEPRRRYIDMSSMTLNGNWLPARFVESELLCAHYSPSFAPIITKIKNQSQPGFFLTPGTEGDFKIRVRWGQNRHGIYQSEYFRGEQGELYRDVDAKGIGYTRGFPMRFLSVRLPEMDGDMELRGILHHEVALEDALNSEEIHELGVRTARHVAHAELLELVAMDGAIVPRQNINDEFCVNFDKVRPTVAYRAMGVSSRVQDLEITPECNNGAYVREILDDAIIFVSHELGQNLTPRDYAVWFVETMGKQMGLLHRNYIATDFGGQIHQGLHNVTLDCRFVDTYHYQTPRCHARSVERVCNRLTSFLEENDYEQFERALPMYSEMYSAPQLSAEERLKNYHRVIGADRQCALFIADTFVRSVDAIYPIGNLKRETSKKFEKAYGIGFT